jgi:lysophospholipase L1-like esterase
VPVGTAAPAPSQTAAAPSPLPPGRRRLFLAITLALPWLLLALVEIGLRIAGVGGSYPLFVPYEPEPGWLFTNPDFARRYFAGGPFTPSPHLDFFRAAKAPGTFRVVFQGESSAAGFPYGHGGAPSRMLAQRLQATFPDRPVEVINAAFTAISSYTLLDQADEIVAQQPDAVLIYTGHNEYYGVLGAASTRAFGGARPLVRTYLALQRLRTGQLLGRLVRWTRVDGDGGNGAPPAAGGADDTGSAPRTVMELLAGDRRVPLGSPLYEQGLAQFRANLAELLARYRAHGVPVFVGTLVSNERDQPPFVSAAGPDGAAAHYARARALAAAGDAAGARAAYRAAKERDELRFRAPEAMNAVIREEAARHGAVVVETQAAVERASPGGVPGASLILEHLHPNLDGYFLIADAFYAALRARALPAPWAREVAAAEARREVPVTPVDSIAAVLRTDRLTSGWPFQPRGVTRLQLVDTLRPRTPAERLAQAYVRGEVPWAEATDRLRVAAESAGDPAAGAAGRARAGARVSLHAAAVRGRRAHRARAAAGRRGTALRAAGERTARDARQRAAGGPAVAATGRPGRRARTPGTCGDARAGRRPHGGAAPLRARAPVAGAGAGARAARHDGAVPPRDRVPLHRAVRQGARDAGRAARRGARARARGRAGAAAPARPRRRPRRRRPRAAERRRGRARWTSRQGRRRGGGSDGGPSGHGCAGAAEIVGRVALRGRPLPAAHARPIY